MKLLALDTSTETMSLAVQHGDAVFAHTGEGGAKASSTMIAAIESLMQQAGLQYAQLDAIVFGRGPGSFTGLRTACSVVQGLAFGANVRVLPVDTLLAVAEEARYIGDSQRMDTSHILAALDARMGEVYSSYYIFDSKLRNIDTGYSLKTPQNLLENLDITPTLLAGNIRPVLDAQLPDALKALPFVACLPTASALLRLAPRLIAAGGLVEAQDALPLYIRDKVALTTAEREAHNLKL
jgi:tRNA threonylcarbamoyladenosine biosynthesis protein TsaB